MTSPPEQDHYNVLGVDKDANFERIRKAYRALAKVHHPDISGDENRFKAIVEAFEVLSDPKKRAAYDRSRARVEPIWVETQIRLTGDRIASDPSVDWDTFALVLRFAQTKNRQISVVFYSNLGLQPFSPVLNAAFGARPNDFIKTALAMSVVEIGVDIGKIEPSQDLLPEEKPSAVQAPWALALQAIKRVEAASRLANNQHSRAVEALLTPLMTKHRGDGALLEVASNWSYFPLEEQPPHLLFMRPIDLEVIRSRGLGTQGTAAEVTKNLMARLIWMDGLDNPHRASPGAGDLVLLRTMHDSQLLAAMAKGPIGQGFSGL